MNSESNHAMQGQGPSMAGHAIDRKPAHPARKPVRSAGEGSFHSDDTTSLASERHYTVAEISKMWSLSERTVKRMFQDEPGVIRWGSEERLHKRGYWTIRVPQSVLERVHSRLRQAG